MRGLVPMICAILTTLSGCDRKGPVAPAPHKPLAVVVSADTEGWITPCGCTSNQSGGMPRRASFLSTLANDHQVVYADAGGAPAGTSDYQKIKFEAILQGEMRMKLAAHNLGRAEAALGPAYLREISGVLKVPLVSANVRDPSGAPVAESVRLVTAGSVRIAFTGVLSPSLAPDSVRVDDPLQSVLAAISHVKGEYDVLVVLAYLPRQEIEQFAASFPEADLVIGGPTDQPMPPRNLGPTLLASSTGKGKFVVELEQPAKSPWAGKLVQMDGAFADDASQIQVLQSYLSNLRSLDLASGHTGFTPPLPPGAPPEYRLSTSTSCVSCHKSEFESWSHTNHAKAWQTLVTKGFDPDPFCRKCHTTGYALPGGFDSLSATPLLVSVGCESCHGPSAAHVADPRVHTPYAASDQCTRCHDHDNSPSFQFATYWNKIRHGPATHSGRGE
jgi:hypothetical protein